MSHRETAEQRQIRELRSKIAVMTNQAAVMNSDNIRLRGDLELLQRKQEAENLRLQRQMERQQEADRTRQAHMTERIRQLDQQVQERERIQNARIRAMQNQHQAQVRQMELEFQEEFQGIQQEICQTRGEMRRGMEQLRAETDQKIQDQRMENQRNLRQMSEKLEGEISTVDTKVNSLVQQIAAREQGDRELAQYWAQEAARMLNQLQESFREQLFDTRRVSLLERKIRQASEDIRGGQYQSSITAGRDAFFDALDMKGELAAAELEWNYWFNAVRSREVQLLQELQEAGSRVYEIDTQEGTYEYRNGIDYWTFGQLSITENQIRQVRYDLQDMDSMTLEQLQEAQERLRALQQQLALVENAAHINVAMSVSRYETAARIGNILDSNYEMIDADGEFFAREDREEYHAIFQNPVTGDQAAVVITPVLDEAGVVTNHIELIVGNADNNPLTRDRIAREVAERLQAEGVEGCSFPCARRFGDGTLREVARVGDIAAVEAGDEKVRASVPGETDRSDSVVSHVRRRTQDS